MRKLRIMGIITLVAILSNLILYPVTSHAIGGDSAIIYIEKAEDLVLLSKRCSLDTWSRGKTVILKNDIDLSHVEFVTIPTFGGIFDGNGHTIKNLSLTDYGSPSGFIGLIQEGALIKNLIIQGIITPSGIKSVIGGIAGRNFGTIQGCSFNGIIRGKKQVGGIAGINEGEGLISNCNYDGVVYGEHYVGGIAGDNRGTLLLCNNQGQINTTVEESSFSLEDINIEKLTSFSTADVIDITDVGGIAGFSTGIIQNCTNKGVVGYRSVGYNIGGIVGRNSGWVGDCENIGAIFGRKDVGGIGGQIEPEAFWELTEDSMARLRRELNTLNELIDQLADKGSHYSAAISSQLSVTERHVRDAGEAGNSLIDQTLALINENLEVINSVSARIGQVIVAMEPIFGEFSSSIENIRGAVANFREGMEILKPTALSVLVAFQRLYPALEKVEEGLGAVRAAVDYIGDAMESIKSGLGDTDGVRESLERMKKGFTSLIDGMKIIVNGAEELKNAVDSFEASGIWQKNAEEIGEGADEIKDGANKMAESIGNMAGIIILLEGDFDRDKLTDALESLEDAFGKFVLGAGEFGGGFTRATRGIIGILSEFGEGKPPDPLLYEEIAEGLEEVLESFGTFEKVFKDLEDALDHLKDVNVDPDKTKEDFEKLRQEFDKMARISGDMIYSMIKISEKITEILDSVEMNNLEKHFVSSLRRALDGLSKMVSAMERINLAAGKLSEGFDTDSMEDGMDDIKSALESISDGIGHIKDVVPDIKNAAPYFKLFAQYAAEVYDTLVLAMEDMEGAVGDMVNGANLIGELISDLAKQPQITVKKMEDKYLETKDDFTGALGNILDSISELESILSGASQVLIEDIKQISSQIFVVFDLLTDAVESISRGEGDMVEYIEDISGEGSEEDTYGRISGSQNYGPIQGDINVGGITGSMAMEFDYDLEDEFSQIQNRISPGAKYMIRTMISHCKNFGIISSKKDCAGGIVGLMDFGYVKDSLDKGEITSSGGNYVGGIVGKSMGTVRESYSKSLLSGLNYVGGVAGYGGVITGCYTLVEIEQAREFFGAIAGDVNDIDLLKDNFFVNDRLAAVNTISYQGRAEPMAYHELTGIKGIPDCFKSFELTFLAQDKHVSSIFFNYGDSISPDKVPPVPSKEGYFGYWERDDYVNLTFDRIINAVYEQFITTLASREKREKGLSVILVQGLFTWESSLELEKIPDPVVINDRESLEGIKVTVTDDGQRSRQIRYLPPEEKVNNIILYVLKDGYLEPVEHINKGKYLLFEMEGNEIIFYALVREVSGGRRFLILAGSGLILMLAFFIIGRKRRRTT